MATTMHNNPITITRMTGNLRLARFKIIHPTVIVRRKTVIQHNNHAT